MARSTRSGCGAEALRSSLTSLPGSTSRAGYGVVRRTDGSACWASALEAQATITLSSSTAEPAVSR